MYDTINPLFICLGFPKCATTWIHRQLEDHPQIGCTTTKEVTYWTKNYAKGEDWYLNHFPKDKDYKIFAEVTPHYVNELALSRMTTDLKDIDVKFMLCLRNPYDRTYSHFQDVVRAGRVKDDLEEAISTTPEIIKQSLYANNLKVFGHFFSLDKLYIDFYDNIQSDPVNFIRRLYTFLGVDSTHVPENLLKRVNPGRKSTAFNIILHKTGMFLRNNGLKRDHLIKLGLWPYIETFFEALSRNNRIPQITKQQSMIIENHLRDDLQELAPLLEALRGEGNCSMLPPPGFYSSSHQI